MTKQIRVSLVVADTNIVELFQVKVLKKFCLLTDFSKVIGSPDTASAWL